MVYAATMTPMSDQLDEEGLEVPRHRSAMFRSDAREFAGAFRMTRADKERLHRDAAELGLTMQQLFELRMLGEARPVGRHGRPRKVRREEELPIAG